MTVAGCLGNNGDGTEQGSDGETEGPSDNTDEELDARVGMVYALGGLDDDSFNDLARQGVQLAGIDFNIEFTNREPTSQEEMGEIQNELAAASNPGYDIICCVGFIQSTPLQETAPNFSDQQFMAVDTVVDADNVESYLFNQNEGSFQAGHLAGRLTTQDITAGGGQTVSNETVVGFIGGDQIPPIQEFEAGYKAGVAYANENIDVLVDYVDGFGDVEGARSSADEMYSQGADIIYHAAGGSGEGVFQAAQANERFAIGVDDDQSQSSPQYANVIIASMAKRINNAIYQSIRNVVNDQFEGGSVIRLGLEANGVGIEYGAEIGNSVSDDTADALDDSRQQIINGDITVPTEP